MTRKEKPLKKNIMRGKVELGKIGEEMYIETRRKRKKKREKWNFKPPHGKKTEGISRGKKMKIKFATLNIQGPNMIGKRQEIEKWMEEKRIDILCIQETKINCNATEKRNGYTWYFSSDVKDADRDKANKMRSCNKKVPITLQEK